MQHNISEHHCEEHGFWSNDYYHVPLLPDTFQCPCWCVFDRWHHTGLTDTVQSVWKSDALFHSRSWPTVNGPWPVKMYTEQDETCCVCCLQIMKLDIRHLSLLSRVPRDPNGLVQPVLVYMRPDYCDDHGCHRWFGYVTKTVICIWWFRDVTVVCA